MKARFLTDSGFWIALFDGNANAGQQAIAKDIAHLFEENTVLIPWPTLYEFINTRLARRPDNLISFHQFIQRTNVEFVDDAPYKTAAFDNTLDQTQHQYLTYSLVDQVIREMLEDPALKFDYFATFNERDFKDLCDARGIEILN